MTQPTTDLDLTISNGNELAKSMSTLTIMKLLSLLLRSRTYTAKISNYRPSSGNGYIGLAVRKLISKLLKFYSAILFESQNAFN